MSAWAVVVAGFVVLAPSPASAQPPSSTLNGVPPIIGNNEFGFRSVPAEYAQAIDDFEAGAIADVLSSHGLPETDYKLVQAWGRDEVRTMEYLKLLGIIRKPAAERTTLEAKVFDWFTGVYQKQLIDQAQAAVDEYLEWSGHDLEHMDLDPQPKLPGGGGYCDYRPPAGDFGNFDLFSKTYNPTLLPQCNGPTADGTCDNLATGCPIPWPTVEQFQQWGRFVSQQKILESAAFPNIAMDAASGIGLGATMVATGISTAIAAAQASAVTAEQVNASSQLFFKIFPYAGRAVFVKAADGGKILSQSLTTASRASAGAVRAASAVFVVATIITAIVTIGLESWTIAENMAIPKKLRAALDKARDEAPDLRAILDGDGGAGALLTAFLATTATDVDLDCRLPDPDNAYSYFPCANAPAIPEATASDAQFLVSGADASGVTTHELRPSIYTVDPLDSVGSLNLGQSSRLSGNGWFVSTKYDGRLPENYSTPTTPGASALGLRLYFRDWEGKTRVASRVTDSTGKAVFAVASLDESSMGTCATPSADTAPTCLTDTLRYVQPDGKKMEAQIVTHDATLPTVAAVVPSETVAGQPITLYSTASSEFGSGPFTYRWTVPGGATADTKDATLTPTRAGHGFIKLEVSDAEGRTTTKLYPLLVAQHTHVGIGVWNPAPTEYGESVQVWARVTPDLVEGTQCQSQTTSPTGEIIFRACEVYPTGSVQFWLDGTPLGSPVPVTPNYTPPCFTSGGCSITIGENHVYAPAITLKGLGDVGAHEITATYFGDALYVGSTTTDSVQVEPSSTTTTLTSGPVYPGLQGQTLSAHVAGANGSNVTKGTVQFLLASSETGPLTNLGPPVPVDSQGQATLPNRSLDPAPPYLAARYIPAGSYAESTSARQPVSIATASRVTISPTSTTAPIGTPVTLTVTAYDADNKPMPGATVELFRSGIFNLFPTGTANTDAQGRATFVVNGAQEQVVTYFGRVNKTVLTDNATVTHTNDTSPPTVTISDKPSFQSAATAGTFTFSAVDGGAGPVTVQCSLDDADFGDCTTATTYAYSGLTDGGHTFTVKAVDGVGNSAQASWPWTIDTQGPTITITGKPDKVTSETSADFTYTASDDGVGIGRVECTLDGVTVLFCDQTETVYDSLGEGSHTFVVTVVDGAGNSDSDSYTWSVDSYAPTVQLTSSPDAQTDSSDASFGFSAYDVTGSGIASVECKLDAGDFEACDSSDGQSYTGLSDGSHSFTVRATDEAGNVGEAPTHTWTIDTSAPETSITSGPASNTQSSSARFEFSGDDAGGSGVARFECAVDGALTWTVCTSPKLLEGLTPGGHAFAVRAVDALGHADPTPASWTWQVQLLSSVTYTGQQYVALGTPALLSATVSSSQTSCSRGRTVQFTSDDNPTTATVETAAAYLLGTAVTGTSSTVSLQVPTTGWQPDLLLGVTATATGTASCAAATDSATLTVTAPGTTATGGGSYSLPGMGRVNIGFSVRKASATSPYTGRVLLVNKGRWRLQGALSSYAQKGSAGSITGTGTLQWWNPALNGGTGDWVLAARNVPYALNFSDGGTRKNAIDTMGIVISYTPQLPQPLTLPNSKPQTIKGDVRIG